MPLFPTLSINGGRVTLRTRFVVLEVHLRFVEACMKQLAQALNLRHKFLGNFLRSPSQEVPKIGIYLFREAREYLTGVPGQASFARPMV